MVPPVLNKSTLLTKEVCRNLPCMTICLLGEFKGETGTNHHMIVIANNTISGLQPQWWIEKLVDVCTSDGREHGPAVAILDGRLALSVDYDAVFRRYLVQVQEDTNLIPEDQEVETHYLTNSTPQKIWW